MKHMWKYPLAVVDSQNIDIPFGSEFLYVEMQLGQLTLWALCPDDTTRMTRRIAVRGTGHEAEFERSQYIGTCIDRTLNLVWHVFEAGR